MLKKTLCVALLSLIFVGEQISSAHADETCRGQLTRAAISVVAIKGGQLDTFATDFGEITYPVTDPGFDFNEANNDELEALGYVPKPADASLVPDWNIVIDRQVSWAINEGPCAILGTLTGSSFSGEAAHNANTWSGYVAYPTYAVTAADASFILPPLATSVCSSSSQSVAIWTGIGGTGQNPLIQVGWVRDANGVSGAFWEVYPWPGHGMNALNISPKPGDLVSTKVSVNVASNSVTFLFQDMTTGATANPTISLGSLFPQVYDPTTADFITERIMVGTIASALTKFSTFSWSNSTVSTVAGQFPLGSYSPTVFNMVNIATGTPIAHPSSMVNQTGFNETWTACQ